MKIKKPTKRTVLILVAKDPLINEAAQKKLFQFGLSWVGENKGPSYTTSPCIYIGCDGSPDRLCHGSNPGDSNCDYKLELPRQWDEFVKLLPTLEAPKSIELALGRYKASFNVDGTVVVDGTTFTAADIKIITDNIAAAAKL